MTDILERLRDPLLSLDPRLLDAANEIEQLRDKLMNLEYEYDRLYEELRKAKVMK